MRDMPIRALGYVTLSCAVLAATALAPTQANERQKVSPTIVPNFNQPDLSAANNAYQLSEAEQKYDCKKLTGHMQIRIRQLRSTAGDTITSGLSRTMQKVATPFVGGTNRGTDPDGDNARDLSMLRAYNTQLAAKKCQTFDLDAQLKPGATEAPRAIAKPKPAAAPLVIKGPAAAPAAAAAPAPKTQ